MLKKEITYVDFNGETRTEVFYFNLMKSEIAEMELSTEGGLSEKIKKVVDAKDATAILAIFKELIMKAYGKKSEDGKRFIKNEEIKNEFVQSEAYSVLFMELATNSDAASAFINGVVPQSKELPTNK